MTASDLSTKKLAMYEASARLDLLTPPRPATDDELAQAAEIRDGSIRFNANQPADVPKTLLLVGRKMIDWSGGHLHHQEWPTQLSRFFMLGPLMKAYRATGDAAFAEAAHDYIDDWIDSFDAEDIGLRGNTCMDIGIRLGTHGGGGWAPALALFMDIWSDAFIDKVLRSIEQQAQILWKRGIPSRPWGNHRIFGLDGLLHVCLRLPFLPDADQMLECARNGLQHAAKSQFLEDGAHIEATLGYHQHMAQTFIYMHRLGQAFPELGINLPTDRLLKAAEYYLHTQPTGINDTSASWQDRACPDAWATARAWREALTGVADPTWQPARDAHFASVGQCFARSSWEPGADFLAFDAGPYSGAHAHLARLGLVFRSGGRLWIADPGTFDYEMSNPYAIYGRSTPAHSTLNLNGLNQGLGDARMPQAVIRDDLVFLHGIYPGGYWSGEYSWGFQQGLGTGIHGRHERLVLWIRDDYLLVFDALMGDRGSTVENVWQMAPVKGWTHDPETLSWQSRGEPVNFHLQMLLPPGDVRMQIHQGEQDPLRGWFCEAYSKGFIPAPQIVFRYDTDSTFHATLAMPLSEGRQPPVVRSSAAAGDRELELAWPDGSVDWIGISQSLCVPLGEDGPAVTDSPLVWIRLDPEGTPRRHFMMNGTYLRFRGQTLVSAT